MKFLLSLLALASISFAQNAQFESQVIELINKSIYFGDIASYSNLEFVGLNKDGNETYKLSYTYPLNGNGAFHHDGMDIEEITGTEATCEYIYYSQAEEDFFYTGFECSAKASVVLGQNSEFANSEAEISEVLQTNLAYNFILDYEVPVYIETVEYKYVGSIEIYKLDYVTIENESKCEYITFDPEINYLELTNVTCDKPVDHVIDEDLREID